jgi:adenylate cyclase
MYALPPSNAGAGVESLHALEIANRALLSEIMSADQALITMPDSDLSSVDRLHNEAAHELVRWILSEGRIEALGDDPAREVGRPARFINALCRRLVSAGLPLWRVTVYAATLHPQLRGFGWRWRRDGRGAEEVHIAQDTELTDDFQQSPLRGTIEQGLTLRWRIDGGHIDGRPGVSPLFRKFRADGCTEYLTVPLNRIGGTFPVVAWATDRAGGFNESDIALLEEIRPALAAVIEMLAIFLTAQGLFSIYLDRDVGKRVLDGQIKRGHTEPLRAVIMATDLRNFTSLSDQLPGEQVIGILDDYFEIVASSVQAHGGNVLKFIGDGVLAVFGADGAQDQTAARAGLSAAAQVIARLGAHRDGLRAGIGLHIGTAMYGNVGSADRLDFTVIGPAVNLAFRLEALTKELGCPVLVSRAFADAAGMPLESLGSHPIRGFREVEEVFGVLEDSTPRARTKEAIRQ